MRRRDKNGLALDIQFESLDVVKTFYEDKVFSSGVLSWKEGHGIE